ncbi:MAG TPA: formate dehydrogenase accessory protein FdhE, partial [Gemmatimonadales bacterium]|nr:formate dehydrogenase accessory protein FdhE [Gemmatimonadales bacterium]
KSRLRTDTSTRLAELEQRRPEWGTWLALLSRAFESVSQSPVASRPSVTASPGIPLLHQCTLHVDASWARRLVGDLVSTAARGDLAGGATLRGYRPSREDAVGLTLAAVRQDAEELTALAHSAGVDRGALASIAHLAALPLLQSCGRQLDGEIPAYWPQGYCPVCAAWPILAERRGLDRSRRLRCGRCAAEWEVQWLCCIYCGEKQHELLGMLEPAERSEQLKVETCGTCRGYLKSIASLQGFSSMELLLQDLETVELDLVALERGYGKPEERGFRLELGAGS